MNTPVDARAVGDRLARVRERIASAGADPVDVSIVAVTKGFGAGAVTAAVAAGLPDVGENYAQELEAKAAALDDSPDGSPPRWHFIGRLQRNKVRRIAGLVDVWQSIDRLSLGAVVADAAPGAAVLVQVNTSDDPSKAGCPTKLAPSVVDGLRDLGLDVRGLMTIGPLGPPESARPGFRALRGLADRLDLEHCSMGMSADLEVAVEEGATIVRLGTALFGPRPSANAVEH